MATKQKTHSVPRNTGPASEMLNIKMKNFTNIAFAIKIL